MLGCLASTWMMGRCTGAGSMSCELSLYKLSSSVKWAVVLRGDGSQFARDGGHGGGGPGRRLE